MAKTKRAAKHVWTVEEEAMMRRDYADTPTSELAARLGLAIHQVWCKAQRLELKKVLAVQTHGPLRLYPPRRAPRAGHCI